jgi:nucleotide-binding universal stress UspA family protein
MKILAAVDGSEAAFNALRSACALAGKLGAAVTAFYVNKGEEYTPDETGSLSLGERITEELEARGQETIRKSLAIGQTFDVAVEGVMSYGIPADEILNFVEARGIIKMIAMAHSSLGRGAQEFVESPTRAVVTRSRNPVFVTDAAVEIRRILIAVDNSDLTKQVALFGGKLARSLGAELGIIAFVPDAEAMIDEYRLIADVPNIDRHIEASDRELKKILDQAIMKAREILDPLAVDVSMVLKKKHADELIAEVEQQDALVLGLKKGGHPHASLSVTANKLLSSHTVNVFFVQ